MDDHVGQSMNDGGNVRVLDRRGYESEERKTELIGEGPECCGSDELGERRREEFWVRMLWLGRDKGEGDDEAEEEPGKERYEGNERVQTNQTGI